mgnify:CR=1 FL=1
MAAPCLLGVGERRLVGGDVLLGCALAAPSLLGVGEWRLVGGDELLGSASGTCPVLQVMCPASYVATLSYNPVELAVAAPQGPEEGSRTEVCASLGFLRVTLLWKLPKSWPRCAAHGGLG